MQIRTADLEHSTGKCRSRPSISDCLRRHIFCIFCLVPMVIPVFGTRLPSSAILIPSSTFSEREERRRGGTLFYATRSLILSKMLAGRISVVLINEKAPTTLVLGLSPTVGSSVIAAAPSRQSRSRIRNVFPLSLPPVLTTLPF